MIDAKNNNSPHIKGGAAREEARVAQVETSTPLGERSALQETSEDAILEVVGLSKNFGGLEAVKDVSFTCRPGEILGMIGPNGAGKTTVFNLITGFIAPSRGRVRFEGRDISETSATEICRLGIARTFQGIRLFKHMTVLENVWLGQNHRVKHGFLARLAGRETELTLKREVEALLEEFHLNSKRDHRAGDLPFGEMRRLEICRALATSPKLVLLDEPAAGLSPVETEQLIADLRRLPKRGLSVVIIEHDMNVALGLSDRVVVLNFGERIAMGPPDEVKRNPDVINAYLGDVQEDADA